MAFVRNRKPRQLTIEPQLPKQLSFRSLLYLLIDLTLQKPTHSSFTSLNNIPHLLLTSLNSPYLSLSNITQPKPASPNVTLPLLIQPSLTKPRQNNLYLTHHSQAKTFTLPIISATPTNLIQFSQTLQFPSTLFQPFTTSSNQTLPWLSPILTQHHGTLPNLP